MNPHLTSLTQHYRQSYRHITTLLIFTDTPTDIVNILKSAPRIAAFIYLLNAFISFHCLTILIIYVILF